MTDNSENLSQRRSDNLLPLHARAGMNMNSGDEGDKIDFSALLRSLRMHWRWPVVLTGVGVITALILTLSSIPVFESTGSIYLGNAEKEQSIGNVNTNLALLAGLSQAPNIDTQIQIMRSRDIIERAIERSGLNVTILNPDEASSVHFWSWLFSGHSMKIYMPPKDGFHATLVKVIDPVLYGKKLTLVFATAGGYEIRSGKQLLLSGILGEPGVAPSLRLILTPNVPGFLPKPGTRFNFVIQSPLTIYKAIDGNITVAEAGDGGADSAKSFLVKLSFENPNPYVSQDFLNSLMMTYMGQTHAWATGEASSTYSYLNLQLDKVRSALETADKHLAGYQSKSGVLSVTSNAQALITQMADYESQRSALELKLNSLQRLRAELNSPSIHVNPYLISSVNDTVLNGLSDKLIAAQGKKATIATLYKPAAPEMKQADSEIDAIKDAIRNVLSNQESSVHQQLETLGQLIGRYKQRMGEYPQEALQVLSLTRSSEVLGKLYMFLLEKQEEAAISQANTITKNRILDTALVHDIPVTPVAGRNVLVGGVLGLLIGLGVVLGKFVTYKGFHSDEEIRQRYSSLPLFGALPEYPDFNPNTHHLKHSKMIVPDARSGYGEAIRLLRGKIYMDVSGGGKGRVLMLSSASQGDGKTTVASQLATALAQDGKRVLLIDTDLRKPHLHEVMRIAQQPGLAAFLAGQCEWKACLQSVTDQSDLQLQVIAAGDVPPSPAELIGEPRFESLIEEARKEYDYILLDTPPFPMVSDGLTIAPLVDRVLSVIKLGQTSRRAFHEHVMGSSQMNRPRGLVINGTLMNNKLGYHYDLQRSPLIWWKEKWQAVSRRIRSKI